MPVAGLVPWVARTAWNVGRKAAGSKLARDAALLGGGAVAADYALDTFTGGDETPEQDQTPLETAAQPPQVAVTRVPGGLVRVSFESDDPRSEPLDAALSAFGAGITGNTPKGRRVRTYTLSERQYERLLASGALQ